MRYPKIFKLMQRAHSAIFRASDHALRKSFGLTASQQGVLFLLGARDGAPISEIADQLQMGKSSLTGLIDRMEALGLVERRQSEDDGRRFHVFIAPAGRALVEATLPATKRINNAMLASFSASECAVIERFLNHVADNAFDIVAAETMKDAKAKVDA